MAKLFYLYHALKSFHLVFQFFFFVTFFDCSRITSCELIEHPLDSQCDIWRCRYFTGPVRKFLEDYAAKRGWQCRVFEVSIHHTRFPHRVLSHSLVVGQNGLIFYFAVCNATFGSTSTLQILIAHTLYTKKYSSALIFVHFCYWR